jgi:predicted MFS family arabinose efflux permease
MKGKIFSGYQVFVIILLVFLNFIVFLDFVILTPLGPQILRQLSLNTAQYAWVVSVYAFCAGISGFLAAGFADKFDRKKILVFSLAGFILGTFLCAIAPDYNFLLIARIITGSFGGIVSGIGPAIITDLFKMEVRGRVIGFVQMAPGLSQVIGIPLALLISTHFGWHAAFWIIVITGILLGIAVVLWMRPVTDHLNRTLTHNAFFHLIRTISKPNYLLAYTSSMILMLAVWMILPFNATFITSNAAISMNQLTVLYLVSGVATFVSAPIIGKLCDRFGKFNVLLIGSAASLIIIPYYTSLGPTALWLMIILNIIFFVAILSRMISVSSLITGVPEPQDRGAFMSINASIQQIAGGIAAGAAGLIVVQSRSGVILHYNILGFYIMATILALVIVTYFVNRLVKIKTGTVNKG